jgi:osmotically-inducible protein OsmY
MDSIEVDRSSDGTLGDEGIADAVRRELREDASTTDLGLDVEVREGVVYLRGEVPLLEDAENAEAVAATVPGVIEVVDETEVAGLG